MKRNNMAILIIRRVVFPQGFTVGRFMVFRNFFEIFIFTNIFKLDKLKVVFFNYCNFWTFKYVTWNHKIQSMPTKIFKFEWWFLVVNIFEGNLKLSWFKNISQVIQRVSFFKFLVRILQKINFFDILYWTFYRLFVSSCF